MVTGKEDVKDWIADFEWHTLGMHIVTDESKIHVFPLALKGEAREWFEGLEEEKKQTWEQVKLKFFDRFGKKLTAAEAMTKLRGL
ncbi:hypothetical protein GOP47_0002038 [Adiantum capillus-veneris]|uniref:Retrotransposon gag domain-containing protein n=1 Tax=Adiantum capillus-veneris TaxID=13818 RepID=A0A9D4VA65_ADICA|nr:hypothetical protein GOP47_0002038 [Adiantum capillus-veneris]